MGPEYVVVHAQTVLEEWGDGENAAELRERGPVEGSKLLMGLTS